ncbi:MAG: hypothetical protein Fur0010_18590 [Bdellovibrio sp.]
MRASILAVALLASSKAFCASISVEVQGYKETDRLSVIELVQNSKFKKVVLDCSSFLHGLTFTSNQTSEFFFLHESECEKLAEFIIEDSAEKVTSCMLVDFEAGSVSYNKNEKCP